MFSKLFSSNSKAEPEGDPLEAFRGLLVTSAPPPSTPSSLLTDEVLRRYLKARSNSPTKAHAMLMDTIAWRNSYQPATLYAVHTDAIRMAAETGKMFVMDQPDRHGRSVIIMRPGFENSSDAVNNVRYLVYTLERASVLSDKNGDGKYVVVVDFFSGNVSVKNSPGFSVMKETTGILQNHYPERLGAMLMFDAPTFFTGLYRMVRPFIDPITREKIFFVKRGEALPEADLLDKDALPKEYGGNVELKFDIKEYFSKEQ